MVLSIGGTLALVFLTYLALHFPGPCPSLALNDITDFGILGREVPRDLPYLALHFPGPCPSLAWKVMTDFGFLRK